MQGVRAVCKPVSIRLPHPRCSGRGWRALGERLRLLAVGDLLLCGRYDEIAGEHRNSEVFAALSPLTGAADLVVGNMECPLSGAGEPRRDKLCLRGRESWAVSLAEAGFGLVSAANNHMFDYGYEGFARTREVLDGAGLRVVGAGEDLERARRLEVLERRGRRVGFLAFCHASTQPSDMADSESFGVAPLELEAVAKAVRRARPEVDHLVLLLHWGLEYSPLPTPEQVELAHAAVDAGADLIIGHHSHMLQGIEHYNNGIIAYSLGNCTDSDVDWVGPERHYESRMTTTDREGLALAVTLEDDGVHLEQMIPLWLNEPGQPEPAEGDRAQRILQAVEERSVALTNADLERYWEDTLVKKRVMAPIRHWWSQGSFWNRLCSLRLSHFKTLFVLIITFLRIKMGRSERRWSLFNSRNDTRPMPSAGKDDSDDQA